MRFLSFGVKMRAVIKCSAIILILAAVTPANANGCLKAHFMVHHGAAAGCMIHEAKKRAQMEREKTWHQIPHNGEERR
jgi:hypothetical protein